jgi:hypothetical protein
MAEPDSLTQEMLRRLHSNLDGVQGEMRLRFSRPRGLSDDQGWSGSRRPPLNR